METGEILLPPQTIIQSCHKYDGNLCCLSGLRWPCVAVTKWFNLSEFENECWCAYTASLRQHNCYD